MKAIEYFEKYNEKIVMETDTENLSKMINEMSDEMMELASVKNIRKAKAILGLLNEQNQKWNALANLFEKKYGGTILKRNGFKNFWFEQMPELKLFQKGM